MKSSFFYPGSFLLNRGIRACALAFATCSLAAFAYGADVMPSPKLDPSLIGSHKREIVLQLKFGSDGRVTSCDVIKESGLPKLDKAAVSFIRKNWVVPSESGHTARIPIDFEPAPKAVAKSQPRTNKPAPQPTTTSTSPTSSLGGAGGGGGVSSGNRGATP